MLDAYAHIFPNDEFAFDCETTNQLTIVYGKKALTFS